MKTLVIGAGQVGTALHEVIKPHHKCFIRDVENLEVDDVEVLQICYPDHIGFDLTTKRYIERYKPKLTIINSSVKVGTTDRCGNNVVYSPVRGRHKKMVTDLRIYTKFVFGHDYEDRQLAKKYFEKCGMDVCCFNDPSAGELLKLLSNVHMGLEITWRQEVNRILKRFMVDPFEYEQWEKTYRNGYLRSDDIDLVRPIMQPDAIGGHCIIPCTEILRKQFPSKVLDFIIESNEETKKGGVHVKRHAYV